MKNKSKLRKIDHTSKHQYFALNTLNGKLYDSAPSPYQSISLVFNKEEEPILFQSGPAECVPGDPINSSINDITDSFVFERSNLLILIGPISFT